MKEQNGRYILEFAEMDVQHDYLYRLFDLIEQSTEVTDASFMKMILKEIENYLNFHFTSEEHLMRSYEVPGFAEHQTDHENMASQFIRYLNDFDAGQLNPASLRIFLTGWLMEHSESIDSQYVRYIKEIRCKNGFI
jgi:hemerythrin